MKLLVSCPNCEINGYKVILGETLPNGDFAILRRTHTTVVLGAEFAIACGSCGEIVYQKIQERRVNGAIDNNGSIGVLGFTLAGQTEAVGTPGTSFAS